METYENNSYDMPNNIPDPIKEVPVQSIPGIMDYLLWMLAPALLGLITCGIGSLILMIIWACDNKNMARANYFRASFILMGIGVVLGIVFFVIIFFIAMAASANGL